MPYFSNKHAKNEADILLIENKKTLLDNPQVANALKIIFIRTTKNLDLLEQPDELKFENFDEIDAIMKKNWSSRSIFKLKQKFSFKKSLS